MNKKILNHYLQFSQYTNPGLYIQLLKKKLPNDIKKIGILVRKSLIHRTTLEAGNTGTNIDLRFGDMTKVPWYRQPEDDIFQTAAAMLAELFRRDKRGFVANRKPADKLVLTCRYTSILIAAILKSKGIPARVRSGNASYFTKGISDDHWINQYWSKKENRWVTIDVDGSLSMIEKINAYDIPEGKFDFPAKAWLDIRSKKVDPNYFHNACGLKGAMIVAWSLFYDFHCLMNNEVIYTHLPKNVNYNKFNKLNDSQLKEIDELARLMLDPDNNFDNLLEIWNTKKHFRLMTGGLL